MITVCIFLTEDVEQRIIPIQTLIGRKYQIKGNSYVSEIVNGKKKNYPCDLQDQIMIIISQPYLTTIKRPGLEPQEYRVVKVQSLQTGFIYEVLFNEGWLC